MKIGIAGIVLALSFIGAAPALAQSSLIEVLQRHGVQLKDGGITAAFDANVTLTVPVTPGSLASSVALLSSAEGSERIAAAYTFGILAGRSGRAASPQELASAGQSLVLMAGSPDRNSRIAGVRVAGRIFAASYDRSGARPMVPQGMVEAVFALLNQEREVEQLAAMDALGLMREASAVGALTERYAYYRDDSKRALAGGALEALARIGDASTMNIIKQLASDKWAEGKDATALAVAFARERLLKDGSIAVIRQALEDKSRRDQARGYLAELGAPVP